MITIVYNSNPNVSKEYNHYRGINILSFSHVDKKNFDNVNDALRFWQECMYPVTQLSELPLELDIKTAEEIQKEYESTPEMLEEYLHNQRDMYATEGDEMELCFTEIEDHQY